MIYENNKLLFACFVMSDWMTNCYVCCDKETKKAWVIDCGFEPEELTGYLTNNDWDLEKILLSHGHLDHVAGLDKLKAAYPEAKIYAHALEKDFGSNPDINLAAPMGLQISAPPTDIILYGGEEIDSGELHCTVIHTPGHSPGGLGFYFNKQGFLFCGDTLFQNSIGRYDFPNSNGSLLFKSIKEKLLILPEETVICPGHGPLSKIGIEKRENYFLR